MQLLNYLLYNSNGLLAIRFEEYARYEQTPQHPKKSNLKMACVDVPHFDFQIQGEFCTNPRRFIMGILHR